MTDQPITDWEEFIRRHEASGVVELDLTVLKPGDKLLVVTRRTVYTFTFLPGGREAMMTSNRPDRPSGRVRINGGSFGGSSSIKVDHVFCGGNVEFIHLDSGVVYTSTQVRALQVTHAGPPVI
jgi:hypothetical protein